MLETVKKALRISSVHFDEEIQDLIDAGESDLRLAGVYFLESEDALIKRAVTIYVKAHFGYDNPEADRLQNSYIMLKQHLCLAGDYHVPLG